MNTERMASARNPSIAGRYSNEAFRFIDGCVIFPHGTMIIAALLVGR
jgi:hypothetical protein